jgi:hypothetical protein
MINHYYLYYYYLNLESRLNGYFILKDFWSTNSIEATPFINILIDNLISSNNNIEKIFLYE